MSYRGMEKCSVAMKSRVPAQRHSIMQYDTIDPRRSLKMRSLHFRENCARLSFAFLKSHSIVTAYPDDLVIREILLVSSLQRAIP